MTRFAFSGPLTTRLLGRREGPSLRGRPPEYFSGRRRGADQYKFERQLARSGTMRLPLARPDRGPGLGGTVTTSGVR